MIHTSERIQFATFAITKLMCCIIWEICPSWTRWPSVRKQKLLQSQLWWGKRCITIWKSKQSKEHSQLWANWPRKLPKLRLMDWMKILPISFSKLMTIPKVKKALMNINNFMILKKKKSTMWNWFMNQLLKSWDK